MIRIRVGIFYLICGIITACSGSDFDRSLLLENTAQNLIVPAYEDFTLKTDSLNSAVLVFAQSPDLKKLESVQMAWKEAIKSWKRAEVYNFGPVDEMVLKTSIDYWPTSGAGIETAIEEYEGSDDYLMRIGSNRKGLPAIEYLLFHKEPEIIIREFKNENRKVYLKLLSQSLVENSRLILDRWNSGYTQEFIQASGNRPNSGITLLVNEMGYLLEIIGMDKLEIPFGKQTNGVPRLQMLESEYAEISIELIRENLESLRRTFNGGEGQGFDDYLNTLDIEGEDGKQLSEVINSEYETALSILESMEGSLKETIQNDKETVQKLVDSVRKLLIYTEVDMISQLNLLDTFSDNDGD